VKKQELLGPGSQAGAWEPAQLNGSDAVRGNDKTPSRFGGVQQPCLTRINL